MSVKALTQIFELIGPKPTQKLVLLALADHVDVNGYCFPGQRLLMEKTGLSRRALQMTLDSLEDAGLIRRRNRQHLNQSDEYWVLCIRKDEPTPGARNAPGAKYAPGYLAQNMREPGARDAPKPSREPSKRRRRGIAADWMPSEEDRAFARKAGLSDHEIDLEAIAHRTYWLERDDASTWTPSCWTSRIAHLARNRRPTEARHATAPRSTRSSALAAARRLAAELEAPGAQASDWIGPQDRSDLRPGPDLELPLRVM